MRMLIFVMALLLVSCATPHIRVRICHRAECKFACVPNLGVERLDLSRDLSCKCMNGAHFELEFSREPDKCEKIEEEIRRYYQEQIKEKDHPPIAI